MKILFLGNNWVAWQVLRWLKEQNENVVGLIVHPHGKRKYGEELIATAGLEPRRVFDGSRLRQTDTLAAVRNLEAEIGISVYFGFILHRDLLQSFPQGCLNLHPAFLPYNRGAHTNIWSIVDGTPAGVTLHYLDEDVDTGDIIAQRQIAIGSTDTGATLYRKLEEECVRLFVETWPQLRLGAAARHPQTKQDGTSHRVKDIERINQIDLDDTYTARELINVLRAQTFPPYRGAYFNDNGRKIYMTLQLQSENHE